MNSLENPYNFGILDDIHNLFPEILYDPQLFPGESNRMVNWIRYRLTQLFPQTFRRCRIIYETRILESVRADFDDWQFLTNVRQLRAPVQLQMPPLINRNEFLQNPLQSPLQSPVQTPVQTPLQNPLQSPLQTPSRSNSTVNRNLFGSLGLGTSPVVRTWGSEETLGLLTLALSTPTENWLASFFDNVPIRPTGEEIEAASEILQESDIQQDVICTICQEHSQSPISTPVIWRRLRDCQHVFHRGCIDRWFSRNSHCPVCRADIRARRPEHPPSPAQSQMESGDSPM